MGREIFPRLAVRFFFDTARQMAGMPHNLTGDFLAQFLKYDSETAGEAAVSPR
jgi:hypothetical protein